MDDLECDVYALEPSFQNSSDFDNCVSLLGPDRVEKLTLQEALNKKPNKYFHYT